MPQSSARDLGNRQVFPVGTRVRLTQDVERFPHFIAPKGAVGTVTSNDEYGFWVKLDAHLPGAEEWDNEIQWSPDIEDDDPTADVEVLSTRADKIAVLERFVTAAMELDRVWQDKDGYAEFLDAGYPAFLPSFDEACFAFAEWADKAAQALAMQEVK